MKRADLIRHLHRYECALVREGKAHAFYRNLVTGKTSTVPRHSEINDFTAQKICKDLGIPRP